MPLSNKYVTLGEICDYLRLSRYSVWRLRRGLNSFPEAIRPSGRKLLFDRQAVITWAAERRADY